MGTSNSIIVEQFLDSLPCAQATTVFRAGRAINIKLFDYNATVPVRALLSALSARASTVDRASTAGVAPGTALVTASVHGGGGR